MQELRGAKGKILLSEWQDLVVPPPRSAKGVFGSYHATRAIQACDELQKGGNCYGRCYQMKCQEDGRAGEP